MWPYFLMYLLPAFLAINQAPVQQPLPKKWPIIWWAVFYFLALAIGFRYEVGGDWVNYRYALESPYQEPLLQAILSGDPAYKFVSWLAVQTGGGMVFVNTIAALIFSWGLVVFCRSLPRPWLALTAAIPYLVIVVAMGYTRQGVSIGLVMIAFVALSENNLRRYFMFMAIALLFHKSAIIMLPLVALASPGKRWLKILLVAIVGAMLYWLLVRSAQEKLLANYIEAGYSSSGALVRICMNALPALFFLLFRKRFQMDTRNKSFWTMMSLTAIGILLLYPVSPSSTALDRVALYWIPLQLFIFSHLPDVFGRQGKANPVWVFLIVLYYLLVLVVWLFLSDNSWSWLPYKFFPWEWFWDMPDQRFRGWG